MHGIGMATVSWSWRTEQDTVRVPCHYQAMRVRSASARTQDDEGRVGNGRPWEREGTRPAAPWVVAAVPRTASPQARTQALT